jgi:acyl carrier protein
MKNDERLRRIIEKFSKADIQAMEGATRIKDLKFDSLDLLEFQMAIDDEFGIEIAIDDFLKCSVVQDIDDLVEKYLSQK